MHVGTHLIKSLSLQIFQMCSVVSATVQILKELDRMLRLSRQIQSHREHFLAHRARVAFLDDEPTSREA